MDWMQIIVLIWAVVALLFWISNRRPHRFPPGPYGLPLLGYLPFLGPDTHLTITRLSEKYGSPFSLPLGPSKVLVLNDWKSMKEALINNNEIFSARPRNVFYEDFFKYSDIIFSDGPGWKERKRFTLHRLRDLGLGRPVMEDVIMDAIYKVIEEFKSLSGQRVNFHSYFIVLFLNIVSSIVGGKSFRDDDKLKVLLSNFLEGLVSQATATNALYFLPALRYLKIKQYNYIMNCVKKMSKVIANQIDDHISTFRKGSQRDFIDIFLEEMDRRKEQNGLTTSFEKANLLEIIKDLYAAGVETSNTNLLWGLLYMASWPEIQRKVQQQLDEVVGHERMPSAQDRPMLPYVEAVQLEIYRYSTLVPLSVLHATAATVQLFDYVIPKGTTVLQNIYAVHHDPNLWKDPHVFRPERFLNENGKVQKPEYLIPFSVGGRSCLGESLAKTANFLFLSCLLHKFTFSVIPGEQPPSLKPIFSGTLAPSPFSLIVTER